MGVLGLALARSGKKPEAIELRAKLRDIAAANSAAWFDASVISYGLGDKSAAFLELERAIDAGVLPWEFFGPVFDGIRSDPRFARVAAARGIRAVTAGDARRSKAP